MTLTVKLRNPHDQQWAFLESPAKRKVIRAGRRSGKTVGVAVLAVQALLDGHRVLYATPTQDQVETFWFEVKHMLVPVIDAGLYAKNETMHTIEKPTTKERIRAKTAWDANTLRGDYADILIFDEYQLMNEDAWELVGAPMLLDNDGDAIFIYTPPSLRSAGRSKARNPRHAALLYKKAVADPTGRWAAFHFTSHDNPHISAVALEDITQDMSATAYAQEIMAEDRDEAPGALWKRAQLDEDRVGGPQIPRLDERPYTMIVVGVDPSATTTGDECGIVVVGAKGPQEYYVLDDLSRQDSPLGWARAVVEAYHRHNANVIVYEGNQGGEMVAQTLRGVDQDLPLVKVTASRGKQARAEPIAALYEQHQVHHVGNFEALENELCMWEPSSGVSPNRLDALVWAMVGCRDRARATKARAYS